MTGAADLPVWAALAVALLLVGGAGLTLVGAIGVIRLKSFYERVHAPTLGTTFGAGGVLLASMLFFSLTEARPILHEILLAIFVIVTTPVTLMLLVRAALYRDRSEGRTDVPGFEDAPAGDGRQDGSP